MSKVKTKFTVEKQMKIADEVLSKIYPIDPHAIIAGGAPRDWYFGNLASDLDVFFYRPDLRTYDPIQNVFSSVGFERPYPVGMDDLEIHGRYKRNEYVERVFETIYKGMTVQLIQMSEPTFGSVVPKFPLNICKVWYKFDGIVTTPDFDRAVKYKSIVKTDSLYADGDRYLQKILAKFPDYKYYSSYEALAMELL